MEQILIDMLVIKLLTCIIKTILQITLSKAGIYCHNLRYYLICLTARNLPKMLINNHNKKNVDVYVVRKIRIHELKFQ